MTLEGWSPVARSRQSAHVPSWWIASTAWLEQRADSYGEGQPSPPTGPTGESRTAMNAAAVMSDRAAEPGTATPPARPAPSAPNQWVQDAPSMAVPDADAQVIARSCEDPAVFGLIFDRHHDAIYRYVARRAGQDIAADVAAETFTTGFFRRRDYDLAFPDALPWLYGIAHNLMRSRQRAESRMLAAYMRQGADPVADSDAEDAYGRAERRLDAAAAAPVIAAALDAMTAGDRDVLLLLAWTEMSYSEVARALELPVGTVRSRMHRARAQLRPRLAALRVSDAESLIEPKDEPWTR